MISLQIKELKSFMSKFLTGTSFDFFKVLEVTITTYNTFIIDGHTNLDFYSADELAEQPSLCEELSSWQKLRPLCFELIKGKRTPLSFKIVLQFSPSDAASLLSDTDLSFDDSNLKACVLTLKYDGSQLLCVTATSYHTFSFDKSSDILWDKAMTQFLAKEGLEYEILS